MMILTSGLLVLGTLLPSLTTAASSSVLRNTQQVSLGSAFLATANDYKPSSTASTESKNGYFSAELEVKAIEPLAVAIDPLCARFNGTVESKSSSGNETVTTSWSVICRVTAANFDLLEDAVTALLVAAQGDDYTYSFSSYSDGSFPSTDPAIYRAQQKAFENLLPQANTIEDVMLVVTAWQNIISSLSFTPSTPLSSISVNLYQKYDPYPDVFRRLSAPPKSSPPVREDPIQKGRNTLRL